MNTLCIEWWGAINKDGYGVCRVGNKTWLAHRYSYYMDVADIPKDMCILHKCDNRKCINPAHLWLGTRQDNTKDMVNKNRQAKGNNVGVGKLNETKVKGIKKLLKLGYPQKLIAGVYKVNQRTISQINTCVTWKWVLQSGKTWSDCK